MFRLMRLKPPNGWNAVGWELGVVVLGVLLALLAQEWATTRSQHQKARQSLAAIRAEIANHYFWSVEWRVVSACLTAQIDELDERVLASTERLEPAPVSTENNRKFVMRIPSKEYITSAWQAAQSDGVSALFEPGIRTELSAHYEQVRLVSDHAQRNGVDDRRMLTLGRPIPLDPSVRYALLQTLDELRGRVTFMDILSGQIIDHVIQLNMVPPASVTRREVERFGTYQYCAKQGLPMRRIDAAMVAVPN